MLEHTLMDRSTVDSLMGRLTDLEEQKDELLVKITFLRELLEAQEDQLKLVRAEEDTIAGKLSILHRDFITVAA